MHFSAISGGAPQKFFKKSICKEVRYGTQYTATSKILTNLDFKGAGLFKYLDFF